MTVVFMLHFLYSTCKIMVTYPPSTVVMILSEYDYRILLIVMSFLVFFKCIVPFCFHSMLTYMLLQWRSEVSRVSKTLVFS